jgi:hypothetical protein
MPGNPIPFEEAIELPGIKIVQPLTLPSGQLNAATRAKLLLGVVNIQGGFALFRRIPQLATPFDGQGVRPLQGVVKILLKLREGNKNVFHTATYPFSPQNGNDQPFSTDAEIQNMKFLWFVSEEPDGAGNLIRQFQCVFSSGGPLGGTCDGCNTTTNSDKIKECSLNGCY